MPKRFSRSFKTSLVKRAKRKRDDATSALSAFIIEAAL